MGCPLRVVGAPSMAPTSTISRSPRRATNKPSPLRRPSLASASRRSCPARSFARSRPSNRPPGPWDCPYASVTIFASGGQVWPRSQTGRPTTSRAGPSPISPPPHTAPGFPAHSSPWVFRSTAPSGCRYPCPRYASSASAALTCTAPWARASTRCLRIAKLAKPRTHQPDSTSATPGSSRPSRASSAHSTPWPPPASPTNGSSPTRRPAPPSTATA